MIPPDPSDMLSTHNHKSPQPHLLTKTPKENFHNTDQCADERIVEVVTTFPEIHHESTTAVSD